MSAAAHRSGKSHKDENFPVASVLIEARFRAPILAFYNFVRTADDVADSATLSSDAKLALLDRLEAGLTGVSTQDDEAVRLRHELLAGDITDRHARDLLNAFRQDVLKHRYQTFDELMGYCALSAMPVGRFVLDVHGESRSTWPASDAICAALQIINHLQDCGDDFRQLDRCYLPLDDVDRNGGNIESLRDAALTPALRRSFDGLLVRTRVLLDAGAPLATQIVNRRLGLEIGVIHRLASRLVTRLSQRDPLSQETHLSKMEMIGTTLGGIALTLGARLAHPPLRAETGEEKG